MATPDGTTHHWNAVLRTEAEDCDADELTMTAQTDEGIYGVGGDPPDG